MYKIVEAPQTCRTFVKISLKNELCHTLLELVPHLGVVCSSEFREHLVIKPILGLSTCRSIGLIINGYLC